MGFLIRGLWEREGEREREFWPTLHVDRQKEKGPSQGNLRAPPQAVREFSRPGIITFSALFSHGASGEVEWRGRGFIRNIQSIHKYSTHTHTAGETMRKHLKLGQCRKELAYVMKLDFIQFSDNLEVKNAIDMCTDVFYTPFHCLSLSYKYLW